MRYYETVIVYDAGVDDASIKQQIDDVRHFIADHEGDIIHIDEWGRRRLAYPIKKKESGYYTIINFSLKNPDVLSAFDRFLKLREPILRHIILRSQSSKAEVTESRKNGKEEMEGEERTPASTTESQQTEPEQQISVPEQEEQRPEIAEKAPEANTSSPEEKAGEGSVRE